MSTKKTTQRDSDWFNPNKNGDPQLPRPVKASGEQSKS